MLQEEEQALPKDEEVWNAEMEKVEASPLAIAKKVFIVVKTAFILWQTIKAAAAWRRSKKPMGTPAFICLMFSAFIVANVAIYKFTSKEIKPLVMLQTLSNYLAFCILHVLIGYAECKKFEMRAKMMKAFKVFHAIYWIILGMSRESAVCTAENFYPDAFLLSNCFSLGIYIMVYMLYQRDFLMEWDEEKEAVAKKLFVKQTERYLSFYTFIIEWHVFELILGKGLDAFTDSIMCSADGNKWIFATAKGNLFMMLHIIGTMMATGMARAVFIKTAKANGFFDGVDEASDQEEEPAKVEAKAEETKDTKDKPAAAKKQASLKK